MGLIMHNKEPYGLDRDNCHICNSLEEIIKPEQDCFYLIKGAEDSSELYYYDGNEFIKITMDGASPVPPEPVIFDVDKNEIAIGDGEGNIAHSNMTYSLFQKTQDIAPAGFLKDFQNIENFCIQDTIYFFDADGSTLKMQESYTIGEDIKTFDITLIQSGDVITININDYSLNINTNDIETNFKNFSHSNFEIYASKKEQTVSGNIYWAIEFRIILFNFSIDTYAPPLFKAEVDNIQSDFKRTSAISYSGIGPKLLGIVNDEYQNGLTLYTIKYKYSGLTVSNSPFIYTSKAGETIILQECNMLNVPGDKTFTLKLGNEEKDGASFNLSDNAIVSASGTSRFTVHDNSHLDVTKGSQVYFHGKTQFSMDDGRDENGEPNPRSVRIYPNQATSNFDGTIFAMHDHSSICMGGAGAIFMHNNGRLQMEGGTITVHENAVLRLQGDCIIDIHNNARLRLQDNCTIDVSDYVQVSLTGGAKFLLNGEPGSNTSPTNGFHPTFVMNLNSYFVMNNQPNEEYGPALICNPNGLYYNSKCFDGSSLSTLDRSEQTIIDIYQKSKIFIGSDNGDTFIQHTGNSHQELHDNSRLIMRGPDTKPWFNRYKDEATSSNWGTPVKNADGPTFGMYGKPTVVIREDWNPTSEEIASMGSAERECYDQWSKDLDKKDGSPFIEIVGDADLRMTKDGITINGIEFTNEQLEALKTLLQ